MDQRFDICLYESTTTTTTKCIVSFILVLAYILKLLFGSHKIFFIHACQPLALSFKGRLFSQRLSAFLLVSVLSTWKRKDVRATASIGGNSPTGGFQGVGAYVENVKSLTAEICARTPCTPFTLHDCARGNKPTPSTQRNG